MDEPIEIVSLKDLINLINLSTSDEPQSIFRGESKNYKDTSLIPKKISK